MPESTAAALPIWVWVAFHVFVFLMLALDLGVFNRRPHAVKFKEALAWSIVWIGCALLFNLGVFHFMGGVAAGQFLGAYLVEKALSVDNIFVFLVLFKYFHVPIELRHKVLFWGIIGAIVMRATFIGIGLVIIDHFHWTLYLMGVFLIWTGIKLVKGGEEDYQPGKNPILKLCRRFIPITPDYVGSKFFTRINGVLFATPLFVALVAVETTDVIFAVDSIPAVLAITQNSFIAYTSNILAILGLRALFFLVAGLLDYFHYLRFGLSAILVWVGIKMLMIDFWKPPIALSLSIIALCLIAAMTASVLWPQKHIQIEEDPAPPPPAE